MTRCRASSRQRRVGCTAARSTRPASTPTCVRCSWTIAGPRRPVARSLQPPSPTLPPSRRPTTRASQATPAAAQIASFQPLTASQKVAAFTAFELVASYTKLTFVEAASGLAGDAAFRFARYNSTGSESRFPANEGGYAPPTAAKPATRSSAATAMPRRRSSAPTISPRSCTRWAMPSASSTAMTAATTARSRARVNDNEFSVMTYASYLGSPNTGTATEAARRLLAAELHDVRHRRPAGDLWRQLQQGRHRARSIAGTPSPASRRINGVAAPNTGVTLDQQDLLDGVDAGRRRHLRPQQLRGQDQVDDLRPGHWSELLADASSPTSTATPLAGTPQFKAQGNIYNALLYNGDMRSADRQPDHRHRQRHADRQRPRQQAQRRRRQRHHRHCRRQRHRERRRRRRHDRHVGHGTGHRARHARPTWTTAT